MSLRFEKVANVMEKLERTSKQTAMIAALSNFFQETDEEEIATACYYLLGQIAAGYEGVTLGMDDKTVQEAIALASEQDFEAVQKRAEELGDVGDTAAALDVRSENDFGDSFQLEGHLTLQEVKRALGQIADASGPGSRDEKIRTLAALLAEADEKERRYLGRLAAGTMRLGVGDMTVLDGLAAAFLGSKEKREVLEHAYNMCSDIGHVAEVLARSGMSGVKRIRIAISRPLRPMLAQRVSRLSEIKEKVASKEIAAEEKYDGQRIQAHKDGDDVTLFSRRLDDITHQFPEVVESVRRHVQADKAILDGEAAAYDFEEETFYPFQELMHRRRKHNVEEVAETIPVKYMLFDLLYLDGESWLQRSYPRRREQLEALVEEQKKIALTGRIVASSLDEIEDFFQDCIERNLEGIICKSCADDAVYRAGAREWAWIKWKEEYTGDLSDTLDLVIVGAYAGKGSRAGTYGSLLCAAYNREQDVFQTVCKLGTGFTDEQLAGLPEKLASYSVDEQPVRVQATSDVEPDVWLTPEFVAELLGAEITESPTHTCARDGRDRGLALRFPRFERWRPEKAPDQATTSQEVVQLYQNQ